MEDRSLVLPGMPAEKWHGQTRPTEEQNGSRYTALRNVASDSRAAGFYTGLCTSHAGTGDADKRSQASGS